MVAHNAEPEHLYEKQIAEFFYYFNQLIFFHIAEWKAVQCRTGHDVIGGLFLCIDQSSCTGHLNFPPFSLIMISQNIQ